MLEVIEEQEHMIESTVVSSAETTFINHNFKNDVSTVDREIDRLATKLERDGTLGRFIISIGPCD